MSSNVVTRSSAKQSKVRTRAQQAATEAEQQERREKLYGSQTRAAGRVTLAEAKQQGKLKMSAQGGAERGRSNSDGGDAASSDQHLKDIYHNALSVGGQVRGSTGILYDDRFALHRCLWDSNYPECPARYERVMERCKMTRLVDRCTFIPPRAATEAEVLMKHTAEQIRILKETHGSQDEQHLEELSSHYDAIFIHPTSYETSLLSVGSTIQLVDSVLDGTVQNGMAILRPPGHHAMTAEYNGYCFFNNVAIATEHALKRGLKKILIVDWDIHHGQGTQRMFYSDPRVLYFSIHRYEHGTFWPNLRESDFDYIGEDEGRGYNFNVPLNATGMTNGDYLAIWHQLLLPVAAEYQPELIIISAGYDAAFGCPEGMMEITPAFYAHLLSPLLSLAQGRVAVVLEGGYCLESLAEGCALTLRTLLGDPCPALVEKLQPPTKSMRSSILNCISSHRSYWKCLQRHELYDLEDYNNINPPNNFHKVVQCYVAPEPPGPGPVRYATRNCYPVQSADERARILERLQRLQLLTDLTVPATRVCYVYDEVMLEHRNEHEQWHPEQPERIAKIHQRLSADYQLVKRMKRLSGRPATTEELCLVHDPKHVKQIAQVGASTTLKQDADQFNSVYFHPRTEASARMAAGSVLQVVDEVLSGSARSGLCIVRPPGHHAESDAPHGFCIFNNIAVAARAAIEHHGLKRVLIVDWDVHHGNGTQHIFENDPRVLYISVHRYDNGSFFPKSTDANFDAVGSGEGEGFNVNIPWNRKGMGDAEYVAAFHSIVLPIAYEFEPELVLVSAGFDAAIGDPLGGCRVTPEAYGHFTHWLSALACGRLIVCLEGGYNVNSISHAMAMCGKALLGDPLPVLQPVNARSSNAPNASCMETIRSVLEVQRKYWQSLCSNKKLPSNQQQVLSSASLVDALEGLNIGESKLPGLDEATLPSTSTSAGLSPLSEAGESSTNAAAGSSGSSSQNPAQTLNDYLKANLEALQNEEMFAVVPRRNCPHLKLLQPETAPSAIDYRAPCSDCSAEGENWVCLICFGVYCGRYVQEHMLRHGTETENHPLTLSFADLSVWCYGCDAYIDHPALHPYKNLVHESKFNEPLVWSYGSDLVLEVLPTTSKGD
ncbi:histone deacetylase 6 [Anopheles ziemanni]|uniref:histone deacetylase 6 n=1 Tax=Anopheles coustani TaxID=139045 RepID=UPI002659D07A|nr:histone deacetylase 6 [Anopheles coustani]XP_058176480.1 histone deacetylase 6 [Anopheles ziemanni]